MELFHNRSWMHIFKLTNGHWPVTGSINYWNVFRTSCGFKIHPIISNAKSSICTFHFIFSRVPTRPGRYANSPRGVPTRPVCCGSFILQFWRNVKVQILKIAVICSQDWALIIYYKCFIILRLNMASVEGTEEKGSNSPRSPLHNNTLPIHKILPSCLFSLSTDSRQKNAFKNRYLFSFLSYWPSKAWKLKYLCVFR